MLLVELGALGEGVELARVESAGDEEVPRAARRVLAHVGCLELEEALVDQRAPGDGVHPRAGDERLLEGSAPEVQVAVDEPLLLGGFDLVLDGERGRLAAIEDGEGGRPHLDLPGLHLRVHVGAAADDLPLDADAPLEAQRSGEGVGLGVDVGLEDDLGQTLTVAEVDEDGAAVIAAVLDPAEQDDVLAHVLRGELAAGVGALDLGDEGDGHEAGHPTRAWRAPHAVERHAQEPVRERTAASAERKSRILSETRVRPFQVSSEGWKARSTGPPTSAIRGPRPKPMVSMAGASGRTSLRCATPPLFAATMRPCAWSDSATKVGSGLPAPKGPRAARAPTARSVSSSG